MDINAKADIKTGVETEHIVDVSDRLYKILQGVLVGGIVLVIGILFYQFNSLPQNMPHEISFSGAGKAVVKPDIASVSFGVTAQAAKSQDAVNQSNTKMNAVIAAVKAAGVDEKDIRTTSYNLSPTYTYPDSTRGIYYGGSGVISGYQVDQQVEVKIRDFSKINTILDTATASGANTVGSLYFTVDDMEKVKAEARKEAIREAKKKANAMANQSGLKLGKLISVSEGYSPMPYTYDKAAESIGMGSAAPSVAPQVQPGQQEVMVSVNLTYQVR